MRFDIFLSLSLILLISIGCRRTGDDIVRNKSLIGNGINYVLSKYGRPDRKDVILLFDTTKSLREHQIGLYEYSGFLDSLGNDTVIEYMWFKKDSTIAIWFYKHDSLIVLDNLRWSNDIQF